MVGWAMLLNPDSVCWTINGQADHIDAERSGDMTSLVPIICHTTIASDDCSFSAILARN